MSRLFGPLRQMGYVVPDVEAAMKHSIEVCGVGPWFYAERLPLTSFSYGGKRYDDIHLSIALANSGDDADRADPAALGPSVDGPRFPGREPQGRAAALVELAGELRRALSARAGAGYVVGQEGDAPRGRFVYFRNEGHPGTAIEMSHATPTRRRIFDAVREAAVGWDGGPDPHRLADYDACNGSADCVRAHHHRSTHAHVGTPRRLLHPDETMTEQHPDRHPVRRRSLVARHRPRHDTGEVLMLAG